MHTSAWCGPVWTALLATLLLVPQCSCLAYIRNTTLVANQTKYDGRTKPDPVLLQVDFDIRLPVFNVTGANSLSFYDVELLYAGINGPQNISGLTFEQALYVPWLVALSPEAQLVMVNTTLQLDCSAITALQDLACTTLEWNQLSQLEINSGNLIVPAWASSRLTISNLTFTCGAPDSPVVEVHPEKGPLSMKTDPPAASMQCAVAHVSNWQDLLVVSRDLQADAATVHIVLDNNITLPFNYTAVALEWTFTSNSDSSSAVNDSSLLIPVYRHMNVRPMSYNGQEPLAFMSLGYLRGGGLWVMVHKNATLSFTDITFVSLPLGPIDKFPMSLFPWGMWNVNMERCNPVPGAVVMRNCTLVMETETMDYMSHWAGELLSPFKDRRDAAAWYAEDTTCNPIKKRSLLHDQIDYEDEFTWITHANASALGVMLISCTLTNQRPAGSPPEAPGLQLTKLLTGAYTPWTQITWVATPQSLVSTLSDPPTPNVVVLTNLSVPLDTWPAGGVKLKHDLLVAGWPSRNTVLDWSGASGVLYTQGYQLGIRNMVLMNGGQAPHNLLPPATANALLPDPKVDPWSANLTLYQWPIVCDRNTNNPMVNFDTVTIIVPQSEFSILLADMSSDGATASSSTQAANPTGRRMLSTLSTSGGHLAWLQGASLTDNGTTCLVPALNDAGVSGTNIRLMSRPIAFSMLPLNVTVNPDLIPNKPKKRGSGEWRLPVVVVVSIVGAMVIIAAGIWVFVAKLRGYGFPWVWEAAPGSKSKDPSSSDAEMGGDGGEPWNHANRTTPTTTGFGAVSVPVTALLHSASGGTSTDDSSNGSSKRLGRSKSRGRLHGGGGGAYSAPDASIAHSTPGSAHHSRPGTARRASSPGEGAVQWSRCHDPPTGATVWLPMQATAQQQQQREAYHHPLSYHYPQQHGLEMGMPEIVAQLCQHPDSASDSYSLSAHSAGVAAASRHRPQHQHTGAPYLPTPPSILCSHHACNGSSSCAHSPRVHITARSISASPTHSSCSMQPGHGDGRADKHWHRPSYFQQQQQQQPVYGNGQMSASATFSNSNAYDSFERVPLDNSMLLINQLDRQQTKELQVAKTEPDVAEQLKALVTRMQHELGDQEVDITRVIGQGGSGVVYQGLWRGLVVAVKSLVFTVLPQQPMTRRQQRAMTEAAICRNLQHPNIVATYSYDLHTLSSTNRTGGANGGGVRPLQAASRSGEASGGSGPHAVSTGGLDIPETVTSAMEFKLYIIQEFCDAGTLRHVVDEGRLRMPDTATGIDTPVLGHIYQLAHDVAAGMAHVHSRNIVHGDLTPANVLLKNSSTTPSGLIAKVADFGLSWKLASGQDHVSNARQGTGFYISPEVLHVGIMSKPADVFSFGMLLHEMYHGTPVWRRRGVNMADATAAAARRPGLEQLQWSPHCPPELRELVVACVSPDPSARPTFQTILLHLQAMRTALQHSRSSGSAQQLGHQQQQQQGLLLPPALQPLTAAAALPPLQPPLPPSVQEETEADLQSASSQQQQQQSVRLVPATAAAADAGVYPAQAAQSRPNSAGLLDSMAAAADRWASSSNGRYGSGSVVLMATLAPGRDLQVEDSLHGSRVDERSNASDSSNVVVGSASRLQSAAAHVLVGAIDENGAAAAVQGRMLGGSQQDGGAMLHTAFTLPVLAAPSSGSWPVLMHVDPVNGKQQHGLQLQPFMDPQQQQQQRHEDADAAEHAGLGYASASSCLLPATAAAGAMCLNGVRPAVNTLSCSVAQLDALPPSHNTVRMPQMNANVEGSAC